MKKILRIVALLLNFGLFIFALVQSIREGLGPLEDAYYVFFALFIYVLPLINILVLLLGKKIIIFKSILKIIAIFLNFSVFVFLLVVSKELSGDSFIETEPAVIIVPFAMYLYALINIFALLQPDRTIENNKIGLFLEDMRKSLRLTRKKLILTIILVLIIIFLPFLFMDPPILNFPVDTWMWVGGGGGELPYWDGEAINYIAVAFNAIIYLIISYLVICLCVWVWKNRVMKKIILIIIGIIIFLLLLPHIMGLFSRDIAPIDDSDLQLSSVPLPPEEENAFFDIIDLNVIDLRADMGGVDYTTIDNIIKGEEWDEDLVEKLLSDNSEALDIFDRISKKTVFQDPSFVSPEEISALTPISSLRNIRAIARLNAIKAIKLARDGQGEFAFDEALKSLEIGQKIQNSQAPLVHYLVAIALKNIGLDTIELIARFTPVSPENVISLEEFKENKEWLVTTFKGEYKIRAEFLNILRTDDEALHELFIGDDILVFLSRSGLFPIKNKFYLKPNKTKKIFADDARLLISASKKPCDLDNILEIEALTPGTIVTENYTGIKKIKIFFTENLIGKMFREMTSVVYLGVFEMSCDINSRISSLQATLK